MSKLMFIVELCMLGFTLAELPNCSENDRWACGLIGVEQPLYLDDSFTKRLSFERMIHSKISLPRNFDAREKWPKCESISRIIDQGWCASCWAVHVAMAMSDRLCIASGEKDQFEFSLQEILGCCSKCYPARNISNGCKTGGYSLKAVEHLVDIGAPSRFCAPYNISTISTECSRRCTNESYQVPYEKRFARVLAYEYSKYSGFNLRNIQTEIMVHGPVVGFIKLTADFSERAGIGTVYRPRPSNRSTLHNIRIIGWGTQGGTPYWLVANSWGTRWKKEGGLFKIIRGVNALGIEDVFMAGRVEAKLAPTPTGFATVSEINPLLIIVIFITVFFLNTIFAKY